MSIEKELREIAQKTRNHAHTPYVEYKVGAAVYTSSGKIYGGCNVQNVALGADVCAERIAIFNAISSGEKSINMVYVYTEKEGSPCGMCRQVISEFASPETLIICGDAKGNEKKFTLKELLPHNFTAKHL